MKALLPFVHVKRFLRARGSLLSTLAWLALAVAIGFAAKKTGNGVASALSGTHASMTLPFLSYAVVGGIVAKGGLGETVLGFTLLGVSAGRAARSLVFAALGLGAFFGLASSVLITWIGHSQLDPPLNNDMLTSAWIGALAGAAYAAWFLLGASFFRGLGRGIFFAIDWVFGSAGFLALVLPHGHVASLFGGDPAFHLTQKASCVLLAAGAAIAALYATVRGSRAR